MGRETLATVSGKLDGLIFSQDTKEKAKAVLEELLGATVVVRGTDRTPGGSPIYVERPDNPIRLTAAVKILEWEEGKPRQMIDLKTSEAGSPAPSAHDLVKFLRENPAIVIKVLSVVGDGVKLSQAIDVTPVKPGKDTPPPESHSEGSRSKAP